MAKSSAFSRILGEVIQVARAIPAGSVATFADVGRFLDVVPRQVAYLLARRNDPLREAAPWHRVVADDGSLGRPKYDSWGRSQRELLESEGIVFDGANRVADLGRRRFKPTPANTGVTPRPRGPSSAPARRGHP